MLERLKIVRFKSIKELELEFGQVNLFIGGNGSGKTNVLEAVGLMSACLGRGLGDSDLDSKGLRRTPPELMTSSFKNGSLPSTLELHGRFAKDIEYRVVLKNIKNEPLLRFYSEISEYKKTRIFSRETSVPNADLLDPIRGIWDQIKATNNIPPEVGNEFSKYSRYVIYTPQTDILRGRRSGKVDVPPVGLHGEGLPEAVSSFLAALDKLHDRERNRPGNGGVDWEIISNCAELIELPGWASRFGVHRAMPGLTSRDIFDRSGEVVYIEDRFMHARKNRLSGYDSSEGTLFLLFAAIILSHPDAPKIFALDNVDNALNPKLTRKLIEQIIEVASANPDERAGLGAQQVFITSHNPTALDAFDLFDERFRIFVVRRNERGYTTADRLKPKSNMTREDWQLCVKGRNLSQIWLDGDIPGAMGDS